MMSPFPSLSMSHRTESVSFQCAISLNVATFAQSHRRGLKSLLDGPGERLLLDAFVIGVVSSKVVDDFIDGGVGLLTRLEPTTEYLVVKNGGGTGRGTAGESNSGEGVSGR
ncbi:hypothetical protein V6N12_076484 [Hibiscus sabdariffa]|uniref:Uncharacterized protein n=1 Tax=Hibiscus sabdariffa TaxID=183260 RepID=A0ABR2DAU9_9ROSI